MQPSKQHRLRVDEHNAVYSAKRDELDAWYNEGLAKLLRRYRRAILIVNHYSNGATLSMVARKFGVSDEFVRRTLIEYGVDRREPGTGKPA